MTFLQQQILQPTKHVEELALLQSVVTLISQGRAQEAQAACMARIVNIEQTNAARLVDYSPEAEAA